MSVVTVEIDLGTLEVDANVPAIDIGVPGPPGPPGPAGSADITATPPATYDAGTATVGVAVGTTSGTVAAGNDSRITGAMAKAANLSDVANAATARANLGVAIGTTAGTVAAGDDSRITGAAQKSANLSDLANTATARGNLGAAATVHTHTDADVSPVTPNDQTGTTYTFVLADGTRLVTASNASAQTYTVPPNSAVAYPLGTALQVYAKGAGQITLAAGSGVTLRARNGLKTAGQYAVVQALKVAADEWVVTGDTST